MKRFFIHTIVPLMVLCGLCGVVSCRRKQVTQAGDADTRITVTTTIFAPYDFVRRIAEDKVKLGMLLPPAAESHSFEPTPRDIITIQNSDIFIYVGGESDDWVKRILQSLQPAQAKQAMQSQASGAMKILSLMDTVSVVEEEIVEGMEEEAEEEEEAAYDEHVWTSPRNAALIALAITELLCETDGVNADFYRNNAASYIAELRELDAAFQTVVDNAKRKTIIFGDRFPFRYFADAYGLSYYAAFPGCSTETEPSAATVAFLINKIRSERIPVVFHIELSNESMADTISEATGAKKLLLHACHNISKRDFENGVTYMDLMKANVDNLGEALQ